jgi:para-aminobenzoate synthetase component I
MISPQRLPWADPLEAAAGIDEPFWVLLYSGAAPGRMSYLACGLAERIEGEDFTALASRLTGNQSRFPNTWFGYLGYGLKDSLERLTADQPGEITLPNLSMMRFGRVYAFDHAQKTLTLWSDGSAATFSPAPDARDLPEISGLRSNMSREEYLSKAAHVIERIHAGDLYQANLTRKFMGEYESPPDAFTLFRKLCAASPAPYSAYLRMDATHIVSSSPELFLRLDADGRVLTRPIKGTSARFADPVLDAQSRETLAGSAKDRAENLMIVDLMRNDLSRSCLPGSIEVRDLFEVTTHATIHHMSSTVTGQKRPDATTLDVVKHCFPPGSMTGAPKIRAMNLCSELERQARGVYSGAIGWLGGDGSGELSVVIRTLILQGGRFEFQVGGGIVADSTPQQELKELIDKSRGICAALGIDTGRLAEL